MDPFLLPSPEIRFASDFLRRVGVLTSRLSSSARRREGRGHSALFGAGEEFVGYRPYRAGEDLRLLDWSLMARLDQPLVRVAKREASEEWCLILDTSASMGVGRPGKLQCGAEVAVAIASLGLRSKARVRLRTSSDCDCLSVLRPSDLPGLMNSLEGKRAAGERGLMSLVSTLKLRGVGRLFLIGDFFDLELAALQKIRQPGQDLSLVRVLAQEELLPELSAATEWVDPETGDLRRVRIDVPMQRAYELELGRELENWREFAAKHRIDYGCWSSATAFDAIIRSVLSPL